VEDNGIGIDEGAMQKILSKNFYTSPGTRDEQGTGLGLIICKDLIEKCQGTITIFSRKGEGTRISVSLPQ
jgi:signal transduction histidine kinase